MTSDEFAEKIKAKYPEYKGVDNPTLTQKMLEKYPVYKDQVDGAAPVAPKRDLLQKATDTVTSIFPGEKIGESLGTIVAAGGRAIQGDLPGAREVLDTQVPVTSLIGDYLKAGSLPVSFGAAAPASVARGAAQYGALGAVGAAGEGLADEKSPTDIGGDIVRATAIGGALGGTFGILGKAVSAAAKKAGAPVMEFSSGTPAGAIERAAQNPEAAKRGLKMSVEEIRDMAAKSHASLMDDLSTEFRSGLDVIKQANPAPPPGVEKIKPALNSYADKIAAQFKIGVKDGPKGTLLDFSKSSIVKGGEQSNIDEAIKTLRTWDDFTPDGMQTLAERIGALRNFESGAQTKSSAVLGKVYDKIAGDGGKGIIPKFYPELYDIRQTFHQNKKVLDEIESVLNTSKKDPVAIQSSITRLGSIYRKNRDQYLNIIDELGKRSGTDYLSLIAGTEFQKILPSYVRGLGGGGALAAGAAVLNPYLLLLSPLFSPRAVGAISQSGKSLADTSARAVRGASAQAIREASTE